MMPTSGRTPRLGGRGLTAVRPGLGVKLVGASLSRERRGNLRAQTRRNPRSQARGQRLIVARMDSGMWAPVAIGGWLAASAWLALWLGLAIRRVS